MDDWKLPLEVGEAERERDGSERLVHRRVRAASSQTVQGGQFIDDSANNQGPVPRVTLLATGASGQKVLLHHRFCRLPRRG